MPNTYKSKDERKNQVIAFLKIKATKGERPEATMYQIAKGLDMKPSTHLARILDEMGEEGTLAVRRETHRKNHWKRVYTLKGVKRAKLTETRQIVFNGVVQQVLL